jgi:hypothetical protein
MRCFLNRRIAAFILIAGSLVVLQSGCATEPTSTEAAVKPQTATASGFTLSVYGPDSIYVSGKYTYTAYWNAPYPHVVWYDRFCSTLTVGSCSTTWIQVTGFSDDGSGHYSYTKALTRDCTGGGTKSYQTKVIASGFGVPAQTAYKTTKLCGTNNGGV